MKQQIENIIKTRKYLLEQISDLTDDQLNTIPEGFNNNIIWNLAHLVAAEQGVCYIRGGAPITVDASILSSYKSGTKPERQLTPEEIRDIKKLLLTSLDRLQQDINTPVFDGYKPWTTRYGVDINTITDAVSFLAFHEGLHSGVIATQKKLVLKK